MTVNTFGSFQTERTGRTAAAWLWPFIPISFSAFSLSALFYYHLHHGMELQSPLQVLYARIYEVFGLAPAVMFFAFTLTWSSIWFATGTIERPGARLAKLFAMAVMLGIFINLGSGGVVADVHKGSLGAWLAGVLYAAFGFPSLILVWAVTFASFVLATDFFFSDRFERLRQTAAPASEGGVEPAVTEHLRTLATVAAEPQQPGAEPVAWANAAFEAAPPIAPVGLVDTVDAVMPAPDAAPERAVLEPGSPNESEPLVTVRRSYAERAAERAARREAARAEAAAAREPELVSEPEPAVPSEPVVESPLPSAVAPVDTELPSAPEAESRDDLAAAIAPAEVAEPAASEAPIDQGEPPVASEPSALESEPEPEPAVETVAEAESAPELPPIEVSRPADAAPAQVPESRPERDSERLFAIPRPAPRVEPAPAEEPVRQQNLFGSGLDEALLQDATEVVTRSGRASASLLQRKLRIDYLLARDVLAALAARGVIALDEDASGGRGNS